MWSSFSTFAELAQLAHRRAHCLRPRALAALAILCGVLIFGTAPAGAHAIVISVTPEPDAVLQQSPEEIKLSFSETISIPAQGIRLFDPSGREVSGLTAVARGHTMSAKVPMLKADGSYTVAWKAVSDDGHAVSGAYLFHLRVATLTQPVDGAGSPTSLWPSLLRILGSVLSLGALALILGRPRRPRKSKCELWGLACLGGMVSLFGSVSAAGSIQSTGWSVSLSTSTGRLALLAALILVAGLIVCWAATGRTLEPTRRGLWFERVLVVLAVAVVAAGGHAVAINPIALSATMTLGHVMAALCWGAGLVWLESQTRSASAEQLQADVVRRSPWAVGAVLVLGISGLVLVLDRVPVGELLSSWYGRLALIKLVLLAVAVALALHSRYRLAPELAGTELAAESVKPREPAEPAESAKIAESVERASAVVRLRKSVRLEILVLAAALLLGATLAQIAPPDAGVGGTAGGAFAERAPLGTGQVELRVDPGLRGMNEVHVTALGSDGRLMAGVQDLQLSLSLAADNIGPLKPEMQKITPGHSISYARFPFAGEWTVLVTARVSRFEAISAVFTVPIGT